MYRNGCCNFQGVPRDLLLAGAKSEENRHVGFLVSSLLLQMSVFSGGFQFYEYLKGYQRYF